MEMVQERESNKIKEYDPQKDFIIETPQLVEEIIYIKNPENKKIIKTLKKQYQKGKFLGQGGFAKCYEIKCCDTNKFYAAKVFEKKALSNIKSKKKLISEIKLHKKLSHENIVNFKHFFEDKENVYILLELCTNQTLNELLKRRKRLTDFETQFYCRQIIKAILYLHDKKIIHRDLKLGNLFLTNNLNLKLGDFGLAAKIKHPGDKRKTVCGTPNYIAPEILEKKNGHSFEVDIWSFGVILYTLVIGKPPFETTDVKLTYRKIRYNDYSFPENIKIEKSLKELIENILVLDPEKRLSLKDILNSEYFSLFYKLPLNMNVSILACPPRKEIIDSFRSFNNNDNIRNKKSTSKEKLYNNETFSKNYINSNNNKFSSDVNNLIRNKAEREDKQNKDKKDNKDFNNNEEINKNNKINKIDKNKKENINIIKEGNIINNNFYINVANINNIELKIDEDFINKYKEKCQIIIKNNSNMNFDNEEDIIINEDNFNNNNDNFYLNKNKNIKKNNIKLTDSDLNNNNYNKLNFNEENSLNKISSKTIIKKILEDGSIDIKNKSQKLKSTITITKNEKLDFIVYNINNIYMGIYFNDETNLIRNFPLSIEKNKNPYLKNLGIRKENEKEKDNNINNYNYNEYKYEKGIFLYNDNKTEEKIKFNEENFNNFLEKNSEIDKEIKLKFEIMHKFSQKYYNYFIEKIKNKNNYSNLYSNKNIENVLIKKMIKKDIAILLKLNNKIVQFFYSDRSILAMTNKGEEVFFKDKKSKEIIFDSIKNLLSLSKNSYSNSNLNLHNDNKNKYQEVLKKLKYSKNILLNLLNFEKGNNNEKLEITYK
jgi:polo-like kinase 1